MVTFQTLIVASFVGRLLWKEGPLGKIGLVLVQEFSESLDSFNKERVGFNKDIHFLF